jgi:uncharacterized protein (TIGR02757 family)
MVEFGIVYSQLKVGDILFSVIWIIMRNEIRRMLEDRARFYETPEFIVNDPISVPHQFSKLQDIEIAGFFAALFSWGNRTTIIKKSKELMVRMDDSPHDFILHHTQKNLRSLMDFKHRTFTADDLLFLIEFLQVHYKKNHSLEDAFLPTDLTSDTIAPHLAHFNGLVFASAEKKFRTRKHISTPVTNSSCKRLCMYLRWMVRSAVCEVDFGLWTRIKPSQLICPLDLHVSRVAYRLELLPDVSTNWKRAELLTQKLRELDADDPTRFDFALFNMGIVEGWK